jgi:hypothetical protein
MNQIYQEDSMTIFKLYSHPEVFICLLFNHCVGATGPKESLPIAGAGQVLLNNPKK